MSSRARFAVGIDLGTTNSVVAFTPLGDGPSSAPASVELLPIPQVVAPSTVENRPALPSFLYLASALEGADAYRLPWADRRDFAVGEFARRQSADAPMRTVAAAKSWLAHSRVDRRQPILPWDAPETEVAKVSPVEASRRYLEHLAAAWNAAHPDAPISGQHVVLTVPASFDASARELTRETALAAGLPADLILLEEPQAALYAWLADSGDRWRQGLAAGDTLLVCDIGGGTTDFSLIGVEAQGGDLALQRVAVGNHLLVGGDNMDLALAFQAQAAFAQKGVEVDPWQSVALWHACRAAKELLLATSGPEKYPVSVLGRGRKLIGGTVSVELDRQAVAASLLDGFFPRCAPDAVPTRSRASGFREIGLPFETDTAVTRHLAHFLTQHGAARPTHLLFNGGVLKAGALRQRLLEVLGGWYGGDAAQTVLEGNSDLDYAVARGAAHYGALKAGGKGVRIRGGAARSYYVGVETAGLAIPGAPRPLRAVCAVPFGMEEGTTAEVPGGEIGLVVGEPAHFRFFSSAVRPQDKPGDVLRRWTDDELTETDSLEATLPAAAQGAEDGIVPVRLESRITELGVLELWGVSTVGDERWKLEFSVRADAGRT